MHQRDKTLLLVLHGINNYLSQIESAISEVEITNILVIE